jgi:ribosomal protein L32
MHNVCAGCGAYRADKSISDDGRLAICPECGHAHPFHRLPLLLVGGPSAGGKSTVCQGLLGNLAGLVVLDSDILWRREFDSPETGYRDYFELWLRLAKSIGQSGRPVMLFGAGTAVPDNLEPCIERRYFSTLHYLTLVADDATLTERLRARPSWRGSSSDDFVASQLSFSAWLRAYTGDPPITLLDTTGVEPTVTVEQVQAWARACLAAEGLA